MSSFQRGAEEERDINDLFDDIVLTEERLARKGFEEGFVDGCAQGNQEGYQLGHAQGVQLGEELGNIYGAVVAQQQQPHTEKVRRTLLQLRTAIDEFPRQNDHDADIVEAVESIRTLYKQLRAMLGRKQASNASDNAAAEHKDYSF